MSAEYDAYLSEHISNVQKAAQWMADNINHIITNDAETITIWTNLLEEVQSHDKSKYSYAEYDAYDYHFYGGGSNEITDIAFDYAWLHHQKKNPHHWQYWVLLKDGGEIVPLDMPLVYILEMIADWWSFSWKNGNLMEIFGWYNEHRDKMRLSLSTRIQVELILSEIYDVLVTQLKKENPGFDPASIIEHSSIKKDDDKEYGVPEQKKFPLPDADHVRSAIRFFNYVDPKYEQELADAINEKIAEYEMEGIHVGDENKFKKYVKEEYLEHHGVIGQKWGIQNGPPYPIGSGGAADRSHYNNHTVFVSGSSKTTTEDSGYYRKDLPESIQNELKRHMHEGNKIIVGDAPGIDRQVQDFLNENDYYNVEVYGPGKKVRYSANELWKTNPIDAPEYEEGSKEWLAKKDIAMSKAANEGLAIILDEGATATRKNIRRLADDDKDVKVFSLGADGNDNWVPKKMLKEI